jgi:hypothetical protein
MQDGNSIMRSFLAMLMTVAFIFQAHSQGASPPTFADELRKQRLEEPKPFVITPELFAKMDNYCKLYLDQEGEKHWREAIIKTERNGERFFRESVPGLLKIQMDGQKQTIDLSTMDVQPPGDQMVHFRPRSPVRYTFWTRCRDELGKRLTGISFHLDNPTPLPDFGYELTASWK